MPLIQRRKLILVDVNVSDFKQDDGVERKGFMCTFLNDKGELKKYWTDSESYRTDLQTVDQWHETKAKTYWFATREFKGVTKLTLLPYSDQVRKRQEDDNQVGSE